MIEAIVLLTIMTFVVWLVVFIGSIFMASEKVVIEVGEDKAYLRMFFEFYAYKREYYKKGKEWYLE